MDICCLSTKHSTLRSKIKDQLVQSQNNVSEWSDMSYLQAVVSVSQDYKEWSDMSYLQAVVSVSQDYKEWSDMSYMQAVVSVSQDYKEGSDMSYLQAVVSVSQDYKNLTQRVGLVQNRHHHRYLVNKLPSKALKICRQPAILDLTGYLSIFHKSRIVI